MPKGASPKREHEYKEIEEKFKKEHRYPGREEEVAARIVNKQRAEHGETKSKQKLNPTFVWFSQGKSSRQSRDFFSDANPIQINVRLGADVD